MSDDQADAFHLIVAKMESTPTFLGDLGTFDVVVKKTNAPCIIDRLCSWLLDIMIKGGKKQRGAYRTIGIQGFSKVFRELFAKLSKANSERFHEHIMSVI